MPLAKLARDGADTQETAFRLRGEIRRIRATTCNQLYGKEVPPGSSMKSTVKGWITKMIRRDTYKIEAKRNFLRISNPTLTAPTRPGRKSRPRKIVGRPPAMAKKVPSTILAPPTHGPRRMPNTGAIKSDAENVPATPIIGNEGISRRIEYSTAKEAVRARILVLDFFDSDRYCKPMRRRPITLI